MLKQSIFLCIFVIFLSHTSAKSLNSTREVVENSNETFFDAGPVEKFLNKTLIDSLYFSSSQTKILDYNVVSII